MKKLNKFFAVLVALAMMATLCVSMAFALEDNQTQTDPKLVKELVVAEGVEVPNVVNTFSYTWDAANSKVDAGVTGPAIANQEIKISAADADTDATDDGNSKVDHINAAKPAIGAPNGITAPGVYAYTVKEVSSVFDAEQPEGYDTSNKEIIPDTNEYTIRYYVKNKTVTLQDGTTTTELQITEITVEDEGAKKNTTIEDPTEVITTTDPVTGETSEVTNDGGFSFINTLKATDGTQPQDPDNPTPEEAEKFALKLSKTVDGTPEDLATKAFPFKLTLQKAVTEPEATTTVKGYIYTPVYDNEDNLTGYTKGEEVVFTYGEAKDFNLKHGQFLGFAKLPAGTRYNASEELANLEAYTAYTPSYAVTTNAAYQDANVAITGNAATGATLATYVDYLLADKANDKIAYTNDYNEDLDTPTGILISNLPYIALALVAIGGLVAYVVVRRRQDNEA